MKYQGHKNWNHWNVALWIANDWPAYSYANDCVKRAPNRDEAARWVLTFCRNAWGPKTPDGAPFSFTSVRAALAHWGK